MWQPRVIDWFLWVFVFAITFCFVYIYYSVKAKDDLKYLTRGYMIKSLGGLSFALVYIYIYGFGDTFRYFTDGIYLTEIFTKDPILYFRVLFTSFEGIEGSNSDTLSVIRKCYFDFDSEGWFMSRFTSITSILSANTYLGSTFIFSFISFVGSVNIYKLSKLILKGNHKWSFWIAFMIPSSVFWGSGALKDTLTLCAFSILIYSFYVLLNIKLNLIKKILKILLIIICSYVLYILKAYILISFLPWLFFSVYLFYSRKIQIYIFKVISFPIILTLIILAGSLITSSIIESSDKYNFEVIENRAEGFREWHKSLGGSYYELGEIEYTPIGIIQAAPKALSVTLFEPFLWNVKNPLMLLNAIEGIIFLFLFLQVLVKSKLAFFKYIYLNSFLFGGLIFCIIFGVAVGMNSYNYGALARYKLPILAVFLLLIFYSKTKINEEKLIKR